MYICIYIYIYIPTRQGCARPRRRRAPRTAPRDSHARYTIISTTCVSETN